ncbi:MAG: O-antigen ligase family protein, partial [Anaerolineae bacterium]
MVTKLFKSSWASTIALVTWVLVVLFSAIVLRVEVAIAQVVIGALVLILVRQDGMPWLSVGLLQGSMGMLISILSSTSSVQVPDGITLPVFSLLTLVGVGWTLLRYPARTGRLVSLMSYTVILFSIMVFVCVSYSWHGLALDKALKYAAICVVSLYAGLILDKDQRYKLYDLLVIAGLVLAIGIIINWLTGGLGAKEGRYGAFNIETLTAGAMEGLAILIVWFLPRYRRWRTLCGIVLSAGLLLAGSRGPVAALIFSILFLPLLAGMRLPALHVNKRTWLLLVLVGLSVGALLAWAMLFPPQNLVNAWGPLRLIYDTNSQDSNIITRFNLANLGLQDWIAKPILGWGTAGFTGSSPTRVATGVLYPHNIFIEILSEWGLVGLALFCAILLRSVANIRLALRLAKTNNPQWVDESV